MPDQRTPGDQRPEYAASRDVCIRCGAPDAYQPDTCPDTGLHHVSHYEALAGLG